MKTLSRVLMVSLLAVSTGCTEPGSNGSSGSGTKPSPASTAATEPTESSTSDADPEPIATPEGKVLRHAVFFSFKEESSEADVQSVTDAFAALPGKIPEIIDFEWGTNDSPEGLDDGFTHCFMLTFADDAGRSTYLPHDDHKAFGDVLRPHMKDVFVIDYWGDKDLPAVANALRHTVFFRFKEDAAAEDIAKVEAAFAELPNKIDTIKSFEWGTNNSPEKHDDGFTHCFRVTFDSDAGRETYLPHPDHKAFVEVLKPILDAPRVLDYVVQGTK